MQTKTKIFYLMDNVDIERAAVSAVKSYIDFSSQLRSYISDNDRTQIWDGDIFVFSGDSKDNDNFYGRVPVQVKGYKVKKNSEKKKNKFKLTREDLNNYRNDGGCIFFVVEIIKDINNQEFKSRVFYRELSVAFITDFLKQKEGIKSPTFHLKKVPDKINEFQEIVKKFSDVRYKNLVIRDMVEIEGLENRINKLLEAINCIYKDKYSSHFSSYIEDINAMKKERESMWKTIKDYNEHLTSNLNDIFDDVTRAEISLHANYLLSDLYNSESKWMDRFLVMIPKIIKLASDKIDDDDLYNLIYNYAEYLWRQKMYHLIGDYFERALQIARKMPPSNSSSWEVANVLNTMANYHNIINSYYEAEREYKEALEITRGLPKYITDTHMGDVAQTLNNLAVLHKKLNCPDEAEREYKEALEIFRGLDKIYFGSYMGFVAMTLNNLATLHTDLNRPEDAEKEYKEALEIMRILAEDNPAAYMGDVAGTLNGYANLHKDLNRHKEAEVEYKEALEIYRKLAKANPAAHLGDVAMTLNDCANLHKNLNGTVEAEGEYKEALEIYRGLAKDNPAAYIGDVAQTLNNLALLHIKLKHHKKAEDKYKEALKIYRGLAKDNPAAYATQHDFPKAIDTIDEAIACMPKDAEYYDSKGEILLMNGDEQGALAMWHKVIELDPDFLSKHDGETELHRQLKERGLIDE